MQLVIPVLPGQLQVRPVLDEAREFLHYSVILWVRVGLSDDGSAESKHGVNVWLLGCDLSAEVLCGGVRE